LIKEQALTPSTFHVEHIMARQHHGSDDPGNLALACERCNLYKGTNLTGIDPQTGNIVHLFHPRKDVWVDHFLLEQFRIIGITPVGRATAALFRMNARGRVDLRSRLGPT
jgi:hypothetical protein